MTLDLSGDKNKEPEKKPKSMTLKELEKKIREFKVLLVDETPLVTEYYRKITWSFSAMVFVLLGFPLAVVTHRREKTANIALAVACGAVYYLLSLGCEALSVQSITPPGITMWMPNIIGGTIALIFNFQLCRS